MLEQSVGEWLESIGLQQYESKLLLNGFDDVRFLVSSNLGLWPVFSFLSINLTCSGFVRFADQVSVLQQVPLSPGAHQ